MNWSQTSEQLITELYWNLTCLNIAIQSHFYGKKLQCSALYTISSFWQRFFLLEITIPSRSPRITCKNHRMYHAIWDCQVTYSTRFVSSTSFSQCIRSVFLSLSCEFVPLSGLIRHVLLYNVLKYHVIVAFLSQSLSLSRLYSSLYVLDKCTQRQWEQKLRFNAVQW